MDIDHKDDEVLKIREEWQKRLKRNGLSPTLMVVTVKEFLKKPPQRDCDVILPGWFGAKTIRRILYGFDSSHTHIFLYECENRWKDAHVRFWNKCLNGSDNKNVVQKSFNKKREENLIILKDNENNGFVMLFVQAIFLTFQCLRYTMFIVNYIPLVKRA